MPALRFLPWNIDLGEIQPAPLPAEEELAAAPVRPRSEPHDALPFDNLAFEGGGIKAIAYVGALAELEDRGLYPHHIRRVTGSSSGSLIAALAAVGFRSAELQQMLAETNLRGVMQDARFGWLSGVVNMFTVLGLNPGARLLEFLGRVLKERLGSADVTFQQLLERCGRELCVPVTNLNRMCTEYCHPKTTPSMPIRLAVGMSMSLPVLMVPYRLIRPPERHRGELYTDGGLLCNFPVHAFDGWWLSMRPEDTFLRRLRPLGRTAEQLHDLVRFRPRNPRTLGFTVFEQNELDASQQWAVPQGRAPVRPDTPLARARRAREDRFSAQQRQAQAVDRAATRLLDAMAEIEQDGDGFVSRAEAQRLFERGTFTPEEARLLFGTEDAHTVFEHLDRDRDGRISYGELLRFVDASAVPLTAHLGVSGEEPTSVASFLTVMAQAVWAHMRRLTLHPEDRPRVVPIDTDYVSTADFHLQPDDQAFLLETGRRATRAFLAQRDAARVQCGA